MDVSQVQLLRSEDAVSLEDLERICSLSGSCVSLKTNSILCCHKPLSFL
jgi:hypothetical protein